jgi:hypothetical protein
MTVLPTHELNRIKRFTKTYLGMMGARPPFMAAKLPIIAFPSALQIAPGDLLARCVYGARLAEPR